MIQVFIFTIGLAVGSFINAFVYRLKTGESVLWSRSYCPQCKTVLKWYDLIPVFSFLILKGRCRYCHKKISLEYPIAEISTALIFLTISYQLLATSSYNISWLLMAGYWLLIITFLIIIFLSDLKYYIIPDKVVYPAIILALFFTVIENWPLRIENSNLSYTLLAAILSTAFFLSLVLLSKGRWMGIGDVKLAAFMGLALGWPNILTALFLAFISGSVVGLILIAARKKTIKSEVPFGTFLTVSTFAALLWGGKMIEWYWGLMGL